MQQLRAIAEVGAWREEAKTPLGLVPTMGYLHEGHLSLVRMSRAADAATIVSIFVNPAQFGPGEDLERYPRDIERDLELLASERVDAVFLPEAAEMYPPGFQTSVTLGKVADPLEGASRPGHFAGVATVVVKLFNIVQPQRAYFGQKDAQQLAVIRRLADDLDFPVGIVAGATIREPDGLALSSRNAYLSTQERAAATVLHRALLAARDALAGGATHAEELRQIILDMIAAEPLARVDYVSVADSETLQELDLGRTGVLVSLAVRIGSTRLIDNLVL